MGKIICLGLDIITTATKGLICPKCKGQMRIIAFIEDYKVVRKILDYLGIYEFKSDRPPPKKLAVADSFDDYAQSEYIDYDYADF